MKPPEDAAGRMPNAVGRSAGPWFPYSAIAGGDLYSVLRDLVRFATQVPVEE